jgi:glutathione S-transferase
MRPRSGQLPGNPVICEYLDSLSHPAAGLIPPHGPARWKALRRQALGDGLMDHSVPWRYEMMRPDTERSPQWIERRRHQIRITLAYLETLGPELDLVDVGNLSIACAIGHLEFRFAEENFRSEFGDLYEWFDRFSKRDSLVHCLPR